MCFWGFIFTALLSFHEVQSLWPNWLSVLLAYSENIVYLQMENQYV